MSAIKKFLKSIKEPTASADIKALEQIYWQHHRQVYRICLRMTKNSLEAEEVTQKVFLGLFRKIVDFRGEPEFSVWLRRITVSEVLAHFRHNQSRARTDLAIFQRADEIVSVN
ncbi:MAG TPA: sigma-70 family RNA polymerase sigma factor [Pyrinomonadaceae bacterium]|jgi:RNA polymerase sigma-70 factor (ECF subfamily)